MWQALVNQSKWQTVADSTRCLKYPDIGMAAAIPYHKVLPPQHRLAQDFNIFQKLDGSIWKSLKNQVVPGPTLLKP